MFALPPFQELQALRQLRPLLLPPIFLLVRDTGWGWLPNSYKIKKPFEFWGTQCWTRPLSSAQVQLRILHGRQWRIVGLNRGATLKRNSMSITKWKLYSDLWTIASFLKTQLSTLAYIRVSLDVEGREETHLSSQPSQDHRASEIPPCLSLP